MGGGDGGQSHTSQVHVSETGRGSLANRETGTMHARWIFMHSAAASRVKAMVAGFLCLRMAEDTGESATKRRDSKTGLRLSAEFELLTSLC